VVVGANVAVQTRINGELGQRLDDGVYAAVVSFGVGLLCGLLFLAFSARIRAGLRVALRGVSRGDLRPWELLGGLGGAAYVASQGVTVAALGVALFTVCIVAGQTGNSLIVDRFGLGPGGVRRLTTARVVATLLAIFAVALGVSDRWDVGEFRWAFVIFVVLAGSAAAFQQAFNGQVARVSGSPTVSSVVNFTVGFTALLLIAGGMHLASGDGFAALPNPFSEDWWLYLGGPMGFAYTLGLAVVVRILGVLLFGLCSIAGQLFGALLLDLAWPTTGGDVTWRLVAAVALTFVAAALAGRSAATAARAR
jgi:transporter family-2 protein